MNYKDSGVDTKLSDLLVEDLLGLSSEIGKFAANIFIDKNNTFVSSCDGVGTKTILASEVKKICNHPLNGLGKDCVAMVFNDLLCENGRPLFFMDYFSTSKLNRTDYLQVLSGMRDACKELGVQIVGGETAEMPGMFKDDSYFDVCGFGLGVKKNYDYIPEIQYGDVVIGLKSSGLHSNGFSLIRKLFESNPDYGLDYYVENHWFLIEDLLRPTKLYHETIEKIRDKGIWIKGMAHITGGGLKNVDRILPKNKSLFLYPEFEVPPIGKEFPWFQLTYEWIQSRSKLSLQEMRNIFNCGIGFVVVVSPVDMGLPLDSTEYTIIGEIQ